MKHIFVSQKHESMKLILNIGLENNPRTKLDILRHLTNVPYNHSRTLDHKEVNSTYNGQPERTLVVSFDCNHASIGTIITNIEHLCTLLNQECIAIMINGISYLVYNIAHPLDDRMAFDPKYFVNL